MKDQTSTVTLSLSLVLCTQRLLSEPADKNHRSNLFYLGMLATTAFAAVPCLRPADPGCLACLQSPATRSAQPVQENPSQRSPTFPDLKDIDLLALKHISSTQHDRLFARLLCVQEERRSISHKALTKTYTQDSYTFPLPSDLLVLGDKRSHSAVLTDRVPNCFFSNQMTSGLLVKVM